LFGGLLREQRVEVDLFDAVGLTALFEDGKDLDVPVEVFREGLPISG
jgi:hypothetical protein